MTTPTENKRKDPATFRLELSFDFDQITEVLRYCMFVKYSDNEKFRECPLLEEGRLAGTYKFVKGDTIEVVVIGSQNDSETEPLPDLGIEVRSCIIVSIAPPNTGLEAEYNLSLFDAKDACLSLSDWPKDGGQVIRDPEDDERRRRRVMLIHETLLEVKVDKGLWAMSGYLSVLIANGGPTDNRKRRLYYFDPEGSADGGTGDP